MSTSCTRLIAVLAFLLPAAAMLSSPVLAASQSRAKAHHLSVHKTSAHKSHKKMTPTAS